MDCQEPVTGRRTGQLVLDYLTDAVLSHKPSLTGEPHVVPDSSLAVTVDTQDHVKIVVQKVTGLYKATVNDGLLLNANIVVLLSICV